MSEKTVKAFLEGGMKAAEFVITFALWTLVGRYYAGW